MSIPEPIFTGKNAIFIDQVPSTNIFAMDLIAKTNPSEGTCIYTAYQSAGRGQIGRFWHSSSGQNLLVSYIFYPKLLKATAQFYLNIISALAVKDVIAAYCHNVQIKWPNDVYIEDKKVAGILVQNVLRGADIKTTVIGIGINVNEENFPESLPHAVSISEITFQKYDLEVVRQFLSARLEYYYMMLNARAWVKLKDVYLSNMYRFHIKSAFIFPDESIVNGTIMGIDDTGRLLIKLEDDNIKAYNFREITFKI